VVISAHHGCKDSRELSDKDTKLIVNYITIEDLRIVFDLMFKLSLLRPLNPQTVTSVLGKIKIDLYFII